ncbi:hypothetical protein [Bradyrhizobium acaciae]|uniref:hypothetical protein n=1 Tax=Bradyrhizobium acaciae TaxID=2683706 RepID=UPI001E388CC5|nr:hypothetical protein [Bradyrhizobium acaciae]MCC8982955.1 hypothetical protein [Bradyrhizobium acaciae]
MNKPPLIFLNLSNPDTFSGTGSIIILEYTDEDAAMRAAQKIALETGRSVTIRDERARVIGAVPAPSKH